MKGRRLPRAPQERALIPDEAHAVRRELERQFHEFVELEDEAGYWAWLSLQPGFDPESPLRPEARRRGLERSARRVAARAAPALRTRPLSSGATFESPVVRLSRRSFTADRFFTPSG
jgi:hypothetical protein